ncbi:hypothetical protein [Guptibacillus spartinae]|nr:hypothetical protein [Pseudalkalibacillus spartinae]
MDVVENEPEIKLLKGVYLIMSTSVAPNLHFDFIVYDPKRS